MDDKKSFFGYWIAGLLGAVAGAASMVGLSKLMPKMKKCCEGPEAGKTSVNKRKK